MPTVCPIVLVNAKSALRLNAHRWTTPEIAHYLDWHEHTVRATLRRWQEVGLAGLWEAAGRGQQRRWSHDDWQALEQWVNEPRRGECSTTES